MNTYSIRDLEKISGVKAHTIRIWEQRFNLLEPARTSTNIRLYDDNALRKLLNIVFLLSCGEKISRIGTKEEEEITSLVKKRYEEISLAESNDERRIEALRAAMFQLDETSFEKIFASGIRKDGITTTMLNLIYPFLRQIGMMWCTAEIEPAFEHFISNLVRQKLFAAIDSLPAPKKNSKKFLLFLPEHESHETALLFANYLLRADGYQTLYLGQNVPLNNLRKILHSFAPDSLVTFCITGCDRSDLTELIAELQKIGRQIFIGGSEQNFTDLSLPENFIFLREVSDLKPE